MYCLDISYRILLILLFHLWLSIKHEAVWYNKRVFMALLIKICFIIAN